MKCLLVLLLLFLLFPTTNCFSDNNPTVEKMTHQVDEFWDYVEQYDNYTLPFECLLVLNDITRGFLVDQSDWTRTLATFHNVHEYFSLYRWNCKVPPDSSLIIKEDVSPGECLDNLTQEDIYKFIGYPCVNSFNNSNYLLNYKITTGQLTFNAISIRCTEKETSNINIFTNILKNFIDKFNLFSKKKLELTVELIKNYSTDELLQIIKQNNIVLH